MARPRKFLSKEDCLRAMKHTLSNKAAARFLKVSFTHYKKYAKIYKDVDTGKSLWEVHKNESGKGIPKFLKNKGDNAPLKELIEGNIPVDHFDPAKIKYRLITEGYLEDKCNQCGFNERRVIDFKTPLILHHKNGDKRDFSLDNIELLCYNCSFLYASTPITEQQLEQLEDYVDRNVKDFDWELDPDTIQQLKDLNLYKDDDMLSGRALIDRGYRK